MKKYKWVIVSILLLIVLGDLIFLGYLQVSNIDMTEARLLITYWKEYLVSCLVEIICYLGINKILKDK